MKSLQFVVFLFTFILLAVSTASADESAVVAKCKADLAKRLNLQAQDITVVEAQPVTWANPALGMPAPGRVYLQMMTPGFRVILQARNTQYLYTTSSRAIKYGGPVDIWSYSMLYVEPVKNDPNLNGDLYQCSLLGTNCIKIASGVEEYYPGENGTVIFERRTSRSSQELLYVKASEKEQRLYGAFAFGPVASNSTGDQWAAFVKPMMGASWRVVTGKVGGEAKVLPLPDEFIMPQAITWSDKTLIVAVKKDEKTFSYAVDPSATAEWKEADFPYDYSYVLNKSESLVIEQTTEDNKPVVEVTSVWFTGDRRVIAKIVGMTLGGSDLLGGRYAFIWGEKDSKPAAYTVDISTGEVIPGRGRKSVKPFLYPPLNNPLKTK